MADLNALIAQGYQFQAPPDPFVQYGKRQQLELGEQTNQLNQMKMQEAQAAAVERNALRQLDPSSPDYENQLFILDPTMGMAYRKDAATVAAQKATQEAQKAQALKTSLDNHRSFLVGVNDQPSYDAWRTLTTKNIPELASMLPAEFSPDAKNLLLQTADDISKRLNPPAPAQSNLAKLRAEKAALPLGDPGHAAYDAAIAKESQFAPPAPAAVSPLARLRAEKAALPPGDPGHAAYDAAIAKETQFAPTAPSAPPSMVAEYTFAKTPDGGNFKGSYQDFVTTRAAAGRAPAPAKDDPNTTVASTQVDNAGNVTFYNKFGKPINTQKGAGKPSATFEKTAAAKVNLARDLDQAIAELTAVTKDGGLIDQSTGSGVGRAVDIGARFIGRAMPGDIAIGKLQPVADLALKMVPRFEGPQSNADTTSYKQAAGQLADPTLPPEIRKAAGKTVLRLMIARKGQFTTADIPTEGAEAAPTGGGEWKVVK